MKANFTPSQKEYKNITPFKLFVIEQFPFIEANFDAITEWQLFQEIGGKLNEIINNMDNVTDNTINLYNSYIKLENYVNDYFDNLDVQDEINNKLNEMVEDGTLENILLNYTEVIKTYNTTTDFLADSQILVKNQKIKTLGYYTINDGGGAEYYITDIQNNNIFQINLNNGLYAELITKNNTINIKQIGAKGNGENDDSIYFRKILGKIENIYVPKGEYLFLSTVDLSNYNINIKGTHGRYTNAQNINKSTIISNNGYAFKCKWPKICNFDGLDFNGYGIDTPVGCIVSNCTFTGIIGIYRGRGAYIENCVFKNIEKGIEKVTDATINNNNFHFCNSYCIDMTNSNDNRIENNRFEWSNIALYMKDSLFNIIIGNIFDRQTLYAIQSDTSPDNQLIGNNFERNMDCHLYGNISNWSIIGNRFVRKNVLDDQTGEILPSICFKTNSFGHINLIGNKFQADKIWEKSPIGTSTNNLVGNTLNDYSLDGFKKNIGVLTVPANSKASFSTSIKTDINYLGLSGYSLDVEYVQLQQGDNVYTSGDSRITKIHYHKNGNLNIEFNNTTENEITLTVLVKFIINIPYGATDN